ncbi:MAG: DUF2177 family protein [Pseudomonadota bacterium]|nr:DUF2177 family protein [Pseudomonadota bacterium]
MMLRQLLAAGLLFLCLDAPWIAFMALPVYKAAFGSWMTLRLLPAICFYVMYVLGLWLFVLMPYGHLRWYWVFAYGAAYGLVTYGTYALTCASVFVPFTPSMAIIEMLWGMTVTAVISIVVVNIVA